MVKKDEMSGEMLPATRIEGFGGVSLPEAEEVFKKQKKLVDLAEGLLEEEDYAYIVVFLDPADRDEQPKMYASKEMAEDWAKKYEKSTGKKVKVTRTKLKAAWLRLGLHLGISAPPGQENVVIDKEITPIGDSLLCIKTTGPGYKSVTILGLAKTPDGREETRVLHSETTAALYWASTGRISVRSGASGYTERKFAHKIHDVIAMGETRAFSRAMACLLGFGETTAEEYEEMEPESKPKPKEPPKSKEKTQEKKATKGKETGKASEGDTKEEAAQEQSSGESEKNVAQDAQDDDMPTRQKIVKAAADAVGDAKKVVKHFEDWKAEKCKADSSFDAKAKMSSISADDWKAYKSALFEWIKAETGKEFKI